MRRYVRLRLHVYILGAVEAGRAAWADAVSAQSLDGFLLESLICDKVVVVVGGEIHDRTAIGELRLGSGWSTTLLARALLHKIR
jgi:hypothetical protein